MVPGPDRRNGRRSRDRGLAGLVVIPALVFLAGCSDASPPEPTATPAHLEPTPSLRWLTLERQERLADVVETLRMKHGWAAGCVFRWNADETIFNEFERPAGTAGYSFVNDRELAPAVVQFVEGSVKASGSYRDYISDAVSFYYVGE